ncbi:hypothetical protein FAZ69_07835 [Trinickia terrae]|uniref:Acyl-CoA dehydrogenase/oxidase N-terminal domain-containing protein n=1 Tax=Trinickia terrae TaxID=2571161 RepID=A0A4U1I9A2_9BURK|nr:acyl-CoA dehydrogenase family protein [Trinickia terrae]TKC90064.1 hypothetical protein FAZ69_07835 [Trinickia terrae]
MDFWFSTDAIAMQDTLKRFMNRHVLPANRGWHRLAEGGIYPLDVIESLKNLAKEAGLWNMFLPLLGDGEPGTRMSNLDYVAIAEIMGRVPWTSEAFNCNAPDTGNMELLHMFATSEQRECWLKSRNAFCRRVG